MSRDAAAEKRDPLLGTLFEGRFRIQNRLAAGGYGAIYSAVEINTQAEVALKVLHSNLTLDKACVKRFRREGALLQKLKDPHTLGAFDLGEARDGTLYIVMELLQGETLYDRIRGDGPMPWQKAVEVTLAIGSSLAEAHGAGIVHRDLKPSNIFLQRVAEGDFVKVLDFGIAKILRGNEHVTQLTVAGRIIGTVEYMSPEQLQGELCTARSDMYALGVVLYEMLVGTRPYPANDPPSLLAAMLHGPPLRPAGPAPIPADLERIVMRCLALEPQGRYRDINALMTALSRVSSDEPREATTHSHPDEAPTWFDPRARPNTPPQIAQPPAAGAAPPVVPPAPVVQPPPQIKLPPMAAGQPLMPRAVMPAPAPADVEGRTVRASIPPPPMLSPPPTPVQTPLPATPPSKPPGKMARGKTAHREALNEAWKRTAILIIVIALAAIIGLLLLIRRH